MTLFAGWRQRVGFLPHAVDVFEHGERELTLYLRWRPGTTVAGRWQSAGAWKYRSLKVTVPALIAREFPTLAPARARKAAEAWAIAEAQAQYDRNRGTLTDAPLDPAPAKAPARLTLRAGWSLATDPDRGKYPGARTLAALAARGNRPMGGRKARLDVPKHERNIAAAMAHALAVWGPDAVLEELRPSDFVKLWRRRFAAVRAKAAAKATAKATATGADRAGAGLAAGIATVARVLAVLDWLREEGYLTRGAALPSKTWKVKAADDFARRYTKGAVPEVDRPRYTIDEVRRLFAAARQGEPRVALLIAVGAELRPGQVLRCTRRGLVLPPVEWAAPLATADDTEYGTLTVPGAGKKSGEEVHLTRGQRREVDRALGYADPTTGYLRELEAAYRAGTLADYPLFVGEKIARRRNGEPVASVARHATATPLDADNARDHFRRVETAAGIPYVRGRSFYGIRRATVDEATDQELDAGVLKHLGGWKNERTPRDIYKDQASRRDRRKARAARARIRGEAPEPATEPATETTPEVPE